jgi:hypothetical protein
MDRSKSSSRATIRESVMKYEAAWGDVVRRLGGIRLAAGDHAVESTVREEAQAWFLDALRCVPSDAANWLRNFAWPAYRSEMFEGEAHRIQREDPWSLDRFRNERRAVFVRALMASDVHSDAALSRLSPDIPLPIGLSEDLRTTVDAVIRWSLIFNLRGLVPAKFMGDTSEFEQCWKAWSWPVCVAEETLWYWTDCDRDEIPGEKPPRWPRAQKVHRVRAPGVLGQIKFKDPVLDWQVNRETKNDFRGRALSEFTRWLDDYISVKLSERAVGDLIPPPRKRELEHFVWLALYQVEGLSAREIAIECYKSEETVKDACERILRLIALRRRPGKRGPQRQSTVD